MALLVLLWTLRKNLGLDLCVAHAEHGLREESPEDAAFVRQLCRALDLDLAEASLGVRAHAQAEGIGLEMAARDLRWDWLRQEAGPRNPGNRLRAAVACRHEPAPESR